VTRLPIVNARTMEKMLLELGFITIRRKGSHVFYRHPDGRTSTLPHHRGRDLPRSLLYEILREIGMTPEEFIRKVGEHR